MLSARRDLPNCTQKSPQSPDKFQHRTFTVPLSCCVVSSMPRLSFLNTRVSILMTSLLVLFSLGYWVAFSPVFLDVSYRFMEQMKNLDSQKVKIVDWSSLLEDFSPSLISQTSRCSDATMGLFNKIIVVSLPWRMDRREDMERLRHALRLEWTFVDATPFNDSRVQPILDEVRRRRQIYTAQNLSHFDWPGYLDDVLATASSGLLGSDLWTFGLPDTPSEITTFNSLLDRLPSNDSVVRTKPTLEPLTCATQNNTTGQPYATSLPTYMLLTAAKIACWNSHVQLIREIAAHAVDHSPCGDAVLVLEDDIDMEKDIRERLHAVWTALPAEWDVVFLG